MSRVRCLVLRTETLRSSGSEVHSVLLLLRQVSLVQFGVPLPPGHLRGQLLQLRYRQFGLGSGSGSAAFLILDPGSLQVCLVSRIRLLPGSVPSVTSGHGSDCSCPGSAVSPLCWTDGGSIGRTGRSR